MALTPKQARFVQEYLIDLNATAAARRAGYSANTADVQGPRLLGNVRIAAAIHAAQSKRSAKLEITADRVLQELARIGFADPRKLYDESGQLKPIRDMDDESVAAVAQVESFEEFTGIGEKRMKAGDVRKVKLWDKVSALEKIGKHLKLFTDVHEVTAGMTLEIVEEVSIADSGTSPPDGEAAPGPAAVPAK